MRITENLQENFPFITVLNHVNAEDVGIVINQDAQITSMYDYATIRSDLEKQRFLELGEIWWWESNRQIPISIFCRREIEPYRYAIQTFNSKDVRVILGPTVNLMNLTLKRVKRKQVQLIRTPKR